MSAIDLLKLKQADYTFIPDHMKSFAYNNNNTSPSSKKYNYGSGHGDWPLKYHENILDDNGEADKNFPSTQCEIAELDGKSVVEDPEQFIRHYILTNQPVILRDFVRHDKEVTLVALFNFFFFFLHHLTYIFLFVYE
jgi:hypothetical protein